MPVRVSMAELIFSLSKALDTVSPVVMNHSLKVAYIALSIGSELGFSAKEQEDLLIASALHDIGVLSLQEKISLHQFDVEETGGHTEYGYRLLGLFEPFSRAAEIVRHHHSRWGTGGETQGEPVPLSCHVIHLSDRMSVLPEPGRSILDQVPDIRQAALDDSGKMFCPDVVEAFMRVSEKEYFWFDLLSPSLGMLTADMPETSVSQLDADGLLDLSRLYAHIIDFRSPFTATHSSGVAATARALAKASGFSEEQQENMKIAGYLHDIGKLAVPREILEKPAKLSREERNIIMAHPYYSYHILKPVSGLDTINSWGSLHHERIDGSGYPFHYSSQQLSEGSRLMSAADVFTAVSEDRPYRKGMAPESVKKLLRRMSEAGKLDGGSVGILLDNFDEIWSIREAAQAASEDTYEKVRRF